MTKLEDRLRDDLPALADLIMEEPPTPRSETVGVLDDAPGSAVKLELQSTQARRRWPTLTAAAVVAAAIMGVGMFVLSRQGGNPNEADVVTGESSAVPAIDAAGTGDAPSPEAPPAGPELQWTEIDPPFESAFGLDSIGDGRILTRVLDEDGWRVAVTSNGTDWTDVPIPDGIRPGLVDIAGDRWLVAGFELTDEAGSFHHLGGLQHLGTRVFYSDDEGDTWVELAVDLPAGETAVPYVVKRSRLGAALVDGERIVIAVSSTTTLDLWTLIGDRGLGLDLEEIIAVGWTPQDMTVEHRPFGDPDPQRSVFTFEELGLTDDQVDALRDLGTGDLTRVFASDGSDLELVGAYSGWNTYGVVAADGFVLHVEGTSDLLLTSADGTDWTQIPMDPSYEYAPYPVAVDDTGSVWVVATVNGAATVVKSLDRLHDPETVAILEGAGCVCELDAGPAGLAAVAWPAVDNVDGTPVLHEPWQWGGLDTLVGWSADGVEWDWSTVGEVLGVSEGEPLTRLAVGEDFVLANAVIYEEPFEVLRVTDAELGLLAYPMPTGEASSRWFIAKVS